MSKLKFHGRARTPAYEYLAGFMRRGVAPEECVGQLNDLLPYHPDTVDLEREDIVWRVRLRSQTPGGLKSPNGVPRKDHLVFSPEVHGTPHRFGLRNALEAYFECSSPKATRFMRELVRPLMIEVASDYCHCGEPAALAHHSVPFAELRDAFFARHSLEPDMACDWFEIPDHADAWVVFHNERAILVPLCVRCHHAEHGWEFKNNEQMTLL